jgi:benzodiazapine receptor
MNKYVALALFVIVTVAAASSGSVFQPGVWYEGLAKPEWTPPSWLFPIAWFTLYVMIALAGWLAWRAQGTGGTSMKFWVAQLVFNAAWSYIMFGAHQIGFALVDLIAMWLMIVGFIVTAWNSSRTAALLFIPYLAWATFAGALNFAVWQLNPGV